MARLAYWAGHARVCHERRRTHARVRRRGCRGVRPPLRPAQGRRVPVSPPPLPAERDRRRALPGCVVEPDPRPRELCTDGEVHDLAVSPRAQPLDRSPSRRGPSHARLRRRRSARGPDRGDSRRARRRAPRARRSPGAGRASARRGRGAAAGAARRVPVAAGGRAFARRDRGADRRRRGDRQEPDPVRDRQAPHRAAKRAARSGRRIAGRTRMSENERDRDVDAAWRAASREEPPAALDAAIRAEARRAVKAGPGRAHRRRQWRYPAAAAATVALLALGIVQMTPRDEIEPAIVADQVAPQRAAQPPAAPTPPATPPPSAAASTPRRQDDGSGERFAAPPAPAGRSSGSVAAREPASASAPATAPRSEVAATPDRPEARRDQPSHDTDAQAPEKARSSQPAASAPLAEQRREAATVNAAKRPLAGSPVVVAKVTNLDDAKAKEA